MSVNVEKLITGAVSSLRVDAEIPVQSFDFDARHISVVRPVRVDMVLTFDGKSVIAKGSMMAAVSTACDLCSGDARLAITVDFSERFSRGDEEAYGLDGANIEIERMLSDLIVFSLPAKITCGESCKGFSDMIEQPDETANPFYILKQRHDSDTEV